MEQKDLDFINSRTWYQTIDFGDGVVSHGCKWCGDPAWENIKKFLPVSLEGMRVLDLGCNAGIFCVRAALMGAKEVVGVDWPGWRPNIDFKGQREFVKSYFEKKYHCELPIKYSTIRMEDYLNNRGLGNFEYCIASASLYYTEDPAEVVHNISLVAENVIARLRDPEKIELFTKLFYNSGYTEKNSVQENWESILREPADDFYLYHYTKNREVAYYRIVLGHNHLAKTEDALNIWQLMNIAGTELPIEKYIKRIPDRCIANLPIKLLSTYNPNGFIPDEEQRAAYPWVKLADSIMEKGFLIPAIVEEICENGQVSYVVMEGKHRVTAATMNNPGDPDLLIPCMVVKRV